MKQSTKERRKEQWAKYDQKRNATEHRKTYMRNKMRERRGSRTLGL